MPENMVSAMLVNGYSISVRGGILAEVKASSTTPFLRSSSEFESQVTIKIFTKNKKEGVK